MLHYHCKVIVKYMLSYDFEIQMKKLRIDTSSFANLECTKNILNAIHSNVNPHQVDQYPISQDPIL